MSAPNPSTTDAAEAELPDPGPADADALVEPADTADTADDLLVREGDVAGDYLERLLDILDVDGDIDLDVEGDRASVAIVGGQHTAHPGRLELFRTFSSADVDVLSPDPRSVLYACRRHHVHIPSQPTTSCCPHVVSHVASTPPRACAANHCVHPADGRLR